MLNGGIIKLGKILINTLLRGNHLNLHAQILCGPDVKENLAHILTSCNIKETFRHMAWGHLEQVHQNVGQSGGAEFKPRLNSTAATEALDLKSD